MRIKLLAFSLLLSLLLGCEFSAPYQATVKVSAKYPQTSDSTLMIKVNGEYLFEYYMGSSVNGTIDVSVPLDQFVTFEWREYMYTGDFVGDYPWMSASVSKWIGEEDTGTEIVIDPVRFDPDEFGTNFYDYTNTATLPPYTITNGPRDYISIYYDDTDGLYDYSLYASASATYLPFALTSGGSPHDAQWTLYEDNNPTVTTYYMYSVTN